MVPMETLALDRLEGEGVGIPAAERLRQALDIIEKVKSLKVSHHVDLVDLTNLSLRRPASIMGPPSKRAKVMPVAGEDAPPGAGELVPFLHSFCSGWGSALAHSCLSPLSLSSPPWSYGRGVEGGSWNDLPADLLLQVLGECDDRTLLVAACVCSSWRRKLGAGVRSVSFTWCVALKVPVNAVVRGAAAAFPSLDRVNLRRCAELDDDTVATLARAAGGSLRDLDLSGCSGLTDTSARAVGHYCHRLHRLDMAANVRLTDQGLSAIAAGCPRLASLNVCGCSRLTDASMRFLGRGCLGLEDVNLGWCDRVTDGGLEVLFSGCSRLHTIDLCGCLNVGDGAVLAAAASCRGLRKLGLHCLRGLTDSAMLALAAAGGAGGGSGSLQSLNVSGCRGLGVAAVQAVLDSHPGLHTCPQHRSVNVSGCLSLVGVSCSCLTRMAAATAAHEAPPPEQPPLDYRHRPM